MIRWRTLSPSSFFLFSSFLFSGSRYPSAHWPWPRCRWTDGIWRVPSCPARSGPLLRAGLGRDVRRGRQLRSAAPEILLASGPVSSSATQGRGGQATRAAGNRPRRTPSMGAVSAAVSTGGAAHPEQVNIPAGDEEGIGSAHTMSITRKGTTCRDKFAIRTKSLSRRADGPRVECAHEGCQPQAGRPYSGWRVTFGKV